MNEMRVCIESRLHTSEEIRSAWFTLPIDEEELEEQIGVPIDSEDYRITEMELSFADEVGEDTTIEKLNDLYHTFEVCHLIYKRTTGN